MGSATRRETRRDINTLGYSEQDRELSSQEDAWTGYNIRTSAIKCGAADYEPLYGSAIRIVAQQRGPARREARMIYSADLDNRVFKSRVRQKYGPVVD